MSIEDIAIAAAIVLGAVAAYHLVRLLRMACVLCRVWWRLFRINLERMRGRR